MAKAEDGELGPPEAKRRPLGRLQKVRDIMPDGLKMSRKAIRKEMRNLKKSKRNAYNTKQKVIYVAYSWVSSKGVTIISAADIKAVEW